MIHGRATSKYPAMQTNLRLFLMHPKSKYDYSLCIPCNLTLLCLYINSDFGRLTLDVIGSCAFGIDTNCLTNPNSEFLHQTKEIFRLFDEPPSVKFLMKIISELKHSE